MAKKKDTSWYAKARCLGLPSDMFFLECERFSYGVYKKQLEQARNVCVQCEVMTRCFTHAIVNEECYGVWGGVDFCRRGKRNRKNTFRINALREQHDKMVKVSQKVGKKDE
jgi:WhiB family redox-sensing transcriptional regulator